MKLRQAAVGQLGPVLDWPGLGSGPGSRADARPGEHHPRGVSAASTTLARHRPPTMEPQLSTTTTLSAVLWPPPPPPLS